MTDHLLADLAYLDTEARAALDRARQQRRTLDNIRRTQQRRRIMHTPQQAQPHLLARALRRLARYLGQEEQPSTAPILRDHRLGLLFTEADPRHVPEAER